MTSQPPKEAPLEYNKWQRPVETAGVEPSKGDKDELRERMRELTNDDFTEQVYDEFMQLIEAYAFQARKEGEIEGRIDELTETIVSQGSYPTDRSYCSDEQGIVVIGKTELDARLAKLKQQKEEV